VLVRSMGLRSYVSSWWYGDPAAPSPEGPPSSTAAPAATAAPRHPYDLAERPLPVWAQPLAYMLVVLLLPVSLLRFLLLLAILPLFVIACCLFEKSPATLNIILPILARVALVGFGVWPGLIRITGQPSRPSAPIYLSAPHYGMLDAWLWIYLGPLRPMMMEAYTKIPVIGTVFRATRGIAVPKRTDGASWMAGKDGGNRTEIADKAKSSAEAVKAAIAKHKATFDIEAPNEMPLLICPEGVTHGGTQMLQFFAGAFEGGGDVQPVGVTYPSTYFNAGAFISTLPSHLGRILISPWISITVDYHPVRSPSAEEAADAKLYAANVRSEMAAVMGLPLSSYGSWTLRDEEKAAKAAAKAAKAGAAKELV